MSQGYRDEYLRECLAYWWLALQPRDTAPAANADAKTPAVALHFAGLGRADRARMRRLSTVAEVMLEQATFRLDHAAFDEYKRLVGDGGVRNEERLHEGIAVAAGVLAHVGADRGDAHGGGKTLAAILGEKVSDRRRMSATRFRNLQAVASTDELLLHARRAVTLAPARINVRQLGVDLLRWCHEIEKPPKRPASSVRYHWARDYYLPEAEHFTAGGLDQFDASASTLGASQ